MEYENQQMDYEDTDVKHERTVSSAPDIRILGADLIYDGVSHYTHFSVCCFVPVCLRFGGGQMMGAGIADGEATEAVDAGLSARVHGVVGGGVGTGGDGYGTLQLLVEAGEQEGVGAE